MTSTRRRPRPRCPPAARWPQCRAARAPRWSCRARLSRNSRSSRPHARDTDLNMNKKNEHVEDVPEQRECSSDS
ncbi:unnamed protein product [Colias eurytheme]|nr:unnamed protein product [Colias eurytheme]